MRNTRKSPYFRLFTAIYGYLRVFLRGGGRPIQNAKGKIKNWGKLTAKQAEPAPNSFAPGAEGDKFRLSAESRYAGGGAGGFR
jgi:hypothetical protein